MKIYNEVIIDMNPESDTFEEVLLEDSCEYNGDVDLCRGGYFWGTHEKTVPGPKGRPGISALYRKGLTDEFAHPTTTPGQGVITDIGSSGQYGVPSGAGVPLGDVLGPYGKVDPGARDLPQTVSQGFFGVGKSYPKYEEVMRRASIYDKAFAESYYPEYMKQAFVKPAETLTKFSDDPTVGGFEKLGDVFARSGAQLPGGGEMDFSQILSKAGSDYGVDEPGFGWGGSPIVSKSAIGDIGDAIDALVTAGEDYYSGKEEAKEAHEKGMFDTRLQRQAILEGQAPAEVAREAQLARTGMAYSGPAQAMVDISREKGLQSLRDVTLSERDIESKYKGAKEELEGVYEEQKGAFGTAIKESVEGGQDEIIDYLDALQGLPEEHRAYGKRMEGEQAGPTMRIGSMEYRGGDVGDLPGYTGGLEAAPEQGFYGEQRLSEMSPTLGSAEQVLQQANRLASFLTQQTGKEIGSWIPTEGT